MGGVPAPNCLAAAAKEGALGPFGEPQRTTKIRVCRRWEVGQHAGTRTLVNEPARSGHDDSFGAFEPVPRALHTLN